MQPARGREFSTKTLTHVPLAIFRLSSGNWLNAMSQRLCNKGNLRGHFLPNLLHSDSKGIDDDWPKADWPKAEVDNDWPKAEVDNDWPKAEFADMANGT